MRVLGIVGALIAITIHHSLCLQINIPLTANANKSRHSYLLAQPTTTNTDTIKHQHSTSSRQLALQALIETPKSKDLNPVTRLESTITFLQADKRDRAFARNLVSTTSRRLGQIDAVLSKCCDTYPPTGKFSSIVQACLRLGTAQILFLNTPSFAAVKETIDELKKSQKVPIPVPVIKFCNAVLRRVGREGEELLKETSLIQNLSPFLYDGLINAYGEEKTHQIVHQLMDDTSHSKVDLSINMYGLQGEEREQRIKDVINTFTESDQNFESVSLLPNDSIRIVKGANTGKVSEWPLYNEGIWWVQDVSSTLPAIALTSTLTKQYGDIQGLHVIDCCAAPGGKTSQLLSAGFQVTAIESSARRSRRLKENIERIQLNEKCKLIVSPGQNWLPEENDMPIVGVLVDAPCSASGTGNKNPDALRRSNFGNLLETQELLANHFTDIVLKPGGLLVYATCSLHPEESEHQILNLIQKGTMQTIPFKKGEIPGFDDAIDENGWLRVLPGTLEGDLKECDGFFVARLVKV